MSREARSRAAKPRETKRRQSLLEDAFHRAGSAAAFTAANVPLKQGQIDERPLIAVSAGNFNTANPKGITNKISHHGVHQQKNLRKSLYLTMLWR